MNIALLIDGPFEGTSLQGPAGEPIVLQLGERKVTYRWVRSARRAAEVTVEGFTVRRYRAARS